MYFVARTALLYVLIFLPPAMRETYSAAFVHTSQSAIEFFGQDEDVRIVGKIRGRRGNDTRVKWFDSHDGSRHVVTLDSQRVAYQPVAFTLALILATKLLWSQRLIALCLGMLIVQGYVILRVALVITTRLRGLPELAQRFSEPDGSTPFLNDLVEFVYRLLHLGPICYLIPFLIAWIAVARWVRVPVFNGANRNRRVKPT